MSDVESWFICKCCPFLKLNHQEGLLYFILPNGKRYVEMAAFTCTRYELLRALKFKRPLGVPDITLNTAVEDCRSPCQWLTVSVCLKGHPSAVYILIWLIQSAAQFRTLIILKGNMPRHISCISFGA